MQQVVDELVHAYRRGGPLLLLFDYDGTLAPIAAHPRLATLPAETRQVLARLMKCDNVRIGVLSGRTLDDLKTMLALPGLYLAGTGGLELELDGVKVVHPFASVAAATLQDVGRQLQEHLAAYPDAWVENKRCAWTAHYRNVPANQIGELCAGIEEVVDPYEGQVRVVPGPMALEITADLDWNKGEAIRLILTHLGVPNVTALFAGDGANDAEAFETVASRGGICIGIGADALRDAEYRLPDPPALTAFLDRLCASLEKTKPARGGKDCQALHGSWKPVRQS